MVRIAVNGFGRIGRNFVRAALQRKDITVVAINDLTTAGVMAHLFKYDSLHGVYPGEVTTTEEALVVNGQSIQILAQRDPGRLPWKALAIDVVIESTGLFTARHDAIKHLEAGAKKVIITAPTKGEDVTIVLGANESDYQPKKHAIISGSSAALQGLAPILKIIHEAGQIKQASVTELDSYSQDQKILDYPHADLRLARAPFLSIIPAPTRLAEDIGLVVPALRGLLHACSMRVPVPDVSALQCVIQVDRPVTKQAVNDLFVAAAQKHANILGYTHKPLVSVDYNSDSRSAIIDGTATNVQGGTLLTVFAWFDNESAYAARLIDMVDFLKGTL
jgi:glyceraldehyde 3-phosphate dehydrogenase